MDNFDEIFLESGYCYKCEAFGCDKCPTFGFDKPRFCATHKLEGMRNVIHGECEEKGCNKRPYYGFVVRTIVSVGGSTKSVFGPAKFCKDHAPEGAANVEYRRCDVCDKRSSFNFKGKGAPRFCSSHKEEGMVNVRKG